MVFLFLDKNVYYEYSLEVPHTTTYAFVEQENINNVWFKKCAPGSKAWVKYSRPLGLQHLSDLLYQHYKPKSTYFLGVSD